MENKIVNLQVNDNINETNKSLGTLKSQLRDAQNEVNSLSEKFGATSREAVEAAKQAAVLKDKIGDAKALTEAFNPDAKFRALSNSLTGVAGGFSVLTGAMGAFGANTKAVEEELLKVQSAMALASGLQAVGESIDSFKQLGAVVKSYAIVQKAITAGQWLWNAAQAANPIGLLIAAVAALIAGGMALVNYFKSSSAASAANTKAVEDNKKALESQTKTLERNSNEFSKKQSQELAMAKASGASASAIRTLELKLIDEKLAYEKSARAIAFNTYEKNKNYLASLKAADSDEELIKKQQETTNKSIEEYNKQNQNVQKAFDERKSIQNRHQVEVRQSQTDHNKEVRTKSNEAATKAKEDAIAEAKRIKEENAKDVIAQAEKFRNELEAAEKANADAKKANADALLTEQQLAIQNEDIAYKAKLAQAKSFGLGKEELEIEHLNNLNNINLTAQQKQYDDNKANADALIKIEELKTQAKQKALSAYSSSLKTAASLLGESTAAGKAAAIAATTIDTIQSGVSAFKGMVSSVPGPVGIGLGVVAAAGALASGFASVKQILAVQTPSGGGGGAPSGGGMGSAPVAPQFNVVGQGGANQIAQGMANQEQAPVQAYVVAGAVTSGQALNRNIINNASMG